MFSDAEVKFSSIMAHPSLHQWLQNSQRHGGGQGSNSLMEWVMAALPTVWINPRNAPDMVSKCQTFTDLMQIFQVLGMCQPVPGVGNTQGPDDECFIVGMRDFVLQHGVPSSFSSLMVILALYGGHHINDVTTMTHSLGEVESCHQQKAVYIESNRKLREAQSPSVSWPTSSPVQVTRTQMWSDLLGTGVNHTKIDRKPDMYLLELWKHL